VGDAGARRLLLRRSGVCVAGGEIARLIDGHVHVWRLGENGCTWPTVELPAIYRDFNLDDYRAVLGGAIDGVVLVQSQETSEDTRWLLDLSDPLVAGVVGWVNLEAPDAPEQIRALANHRKLRGLRPMVQDRDAAWYDRIGDGPLAVMEASGLVLDALVRPRHLDSLARLAGRYPALRIVIDHAAKPDSHDFDSWKRAIDSAARLPNMHCKLSGLVTEDVVVADTFAVVWEGFGPDRLIWGSDWPVLNLAASLSEWMKIARSLVPDAHHAAVFGGNARRVYRLS
jgi:L-fuconolactonase